MQVVTNENKILGEKLYKTMCRTAEFALHHEGIGHDDCEVGLSFVSSAEIQELNAQYREVDEATDVLSFPMYENADDIREALSLDTDRPEPSLLLGDVVICIDIAKKQAEEIGQSLEEEILYLFIHSVLHLLGYDHETEKDKRTMRAVEKDILRYLSDNEEGNS